MKVKILILLSLFILATQFGYERMQLLAQENTDSHGVKNTVLTFLNLAREDINAALEMVSANYSDTREGNIIDYSKFKSELEERINFVSKKYVDFSEDAPQLSNLNIQDNKATLEIEFRWKGFDLDTLNSVSGIQKRQVTLAKENGIWKITRWRRIVNPPK